MRVVIVIIRGEYIFALLSIINRLQHHLWLSFIGADIQIELNDLILVIHDCLLVVERWQSHQIALIVRLVLTVAVVRAVTLLTALDAGR